MINYVKSMFSSNKVKPLGECRLHESCLHYGYFHDINFKPTSSFAKQTSVNSSDSTGSINNEYINMAIMCDTELNIVEVSENFLLLTHYNRDELVDEFIGILMTELLSRLHKIIFINKLKNADAYEQKRILHKLSGNFHKREVIIYDKFKRQHYMNMIINTKDEYFIVELNYSLYNSSNIHLYTLDIKLDRHIFIKSNNNIIIMNIDFIDSTLITNNFGVEHMITINKLFYSDIVELILAKYYPYIYIHEIIGDSFILVLNIDWGYTINEICASLALEFLNELYFRTKNYIAFKTSITYGRLHYGYIDHNIRFFGDELNMSSRLHGKCKNGEVLVQHIFFKKLKTEINIDKLEYNEESHQLKGLGMVQCVKIKLCENKILEL